MRYLMTVSYDGSLFSGYQKQPRERTVQGEIEKALKEINGGAKVDIHASGRTDAKVHALAQRIHFDLDKKMDPEKLENGLNSLLPEDIYIRKVEEVKEALLSSDIDWFEYHDVHGIGQSRQERIYRGVQYSTDVIERVAITIVCRDVFLNPTVNVILRVAHTGEIGDGRIFVSDVIDTYSIRTGENGDTVLRDKK